MAMKKKATPRSRGGASYDELVDVYGSDRGGKMKADAAQKKSQSATSAKTNKGASYLKKAATSKKNDLAGASGRDGKGLGRTSGRAYNQVANSFRPLVKKGKAQKASAAKVARGKK
jgi:hypothetical protein